LTNYPIETRAPAARSILEHSGLIDDYIEFPAMMRNARSLARLAAQIRRRRFDLAIHLTVPRGRVRALRDAMFFRTCGIRHQIGVSSNGELMEYRWIEYSHRFEHESERLPRAVAPLGDAAPFDPANFDLRLTPNEERTAARCLSHGGISGDFIACSIGTKFPTNDWGIHNWRAPLARIGAAFPKLGLVLPGHVLGQGQYAPADEAHLAE
jgi:ADP-heptose:LPS heptosyltransferase